MRSNQDRPRRTPQTALKAFSTEVKSWMTMMMSVSAPTTPAVPERLPATKLLISCTSAGLEAAGVAGTRPAAASADPGPGWAAGAGTGRRESRCSYWSICGAIRLITSLNALTATAGSCWLSMKPATSMAMATSGPSPSIEA